VIYDCFPFFNELDLLDIRLHELSDVVDKFVLVEATRTFTGNPKPLYFWENRKQFTPFLSQIIHVVVDDMPMTKEELSASTQKDLRWLESDYQHGANWIRDRHQRNAIMRAVDYLDDYDIIIIEDADEMLRKEVALRLPFIMCDGSNAVEQY
jgi:hypothetical protein